MKKTLMLLCALTILVSVGCGPSKPAAVIAPPYNPAGIASKAMELYDANGDKKLDADELKKCPSMLYSLKGIDTNGDGALDASEISTRIQGWIDMKVALTCPIVKFQKKGGKPANEVVGKMVTLTPDPVMGDMLKTTDPIAVDENCQCNPSTPGNQENLGGMAYGFYNVKIDGTSYDNLGVEIFDGAKEDDTDAFIIELKKGK